MFLLKNEKEEDLETSHLYKTSLLEGDNFLMKWLPILAVFVFLLFTLSSCGAISGLVSDVPSSPSSMDNAWSEICQHEVVSNFTISYQSTDANKKPVNRTCSNYLTLRLSPNDEEEKRGNVFDLFTNICRSEILISAKLSTKTRTLGNATRNCSR